ncbi:hypothetical protein Q8G50_32930, partial [Klebsiella pneumoniae]
PSAAAFEIDEEVIPLMRNRLQDFEASAEDLKRVHAATEPLPFDRSASNTLTDRTSLGGTSCTPIFYVLLFWFVVGGS